MAMARCNNQATTFTGSSFGRAMMVLGTVLAVSVFVMLGRVGIIALILLALIIRIMVNEKNNKPVGEQ